MKCPICNANWENEMPCEKCGFTLKVSSAKPTQEELRVIYEDIKAHREQYTGLIISGDCIIRCTGRKKNIVIPHGIKSVAERAFACCPDVESIYFPETVSSIGAGQFAMDSENLQIIVDSNNPWYYSDSQCIIERATGTIIAGTLWGGIPSRSDVTTIGVEAFAFCNNVHPPIIPSNITRICEHAFFCSGGFEYVVIPKTVQFVGHKAFLCHTAYGIYCEKSQQPESWMIDWNGNDLIEKSYPMPYRISDSWTRYHSNPYSSWRFEFKNNIPVFWGNEWQWNNGIPLEKQNITEQKISGIAAVDNMNGHEFEQYCADLLRKLSYKDVKVTRGSGDQGVDIIAIKDGIKYAIQCKCYASNLSNTPVQEVAAGKQLYKCHVAVVLTNQYFTSGAKQLAEATGVLLWNRDDLLRMMKEVGSN